MNNINPEGKINYKSAFLSKLSNIWYYYKWHILGALFGIILFVCIMQSCTSEKPDLRILYAGPQSYAGKDISSVEGAFSEVLPEDFNGDGKKLVGLVAFNIYSTDEISSMVNEESAYINTYTNSQELASYDNTVLAGEYSVCFVSPWLYERVADGEGFRPLEDVLGYKPDSAFDEYAIKLCDTEFGKKFASSLNMPQDTLVCLRRMSTLSALIKQNATKAEYEKYEKMFVAIVEYK